MGRENGPSEKWGRCLLACISQASRDPIDRQRHDLVQGFRLRALRVLERTQAARSFDLNVIQRIHVWIAELNSLLGDRLKLQQGLVSADR